MGNLLYVEKEDVTFLDMQPSDVMKLIISGGMTKLNKHSETPDQIED